MADLAKLDEIWADDLLHVREDAEFLQRFLVGKAEERRKLELPGAYVVNIDAEWGAGKTFLLDRFARQLEPENYVVARVNAWKDDHLGDPFASILAAVDEAFKPFIEEKKGGGAIATALKTAKKNALPILGKGAVGVAKTLVKKFVGEEAVGEIAELLGSTPSRFADANSEHKDLTTQLIEGGTTEIVVEVNALLDSATQNIIDNYINQHRAAASFRTNLGAAIAALDGRKKIPLFVLIDELDRCQPSYAVALLERVKHLFDADNLVFVFATNSGELKSTISGLYGPSFNGFGYLKRFFDKTYVLSTPSVADLVESECAKIDLSKATAPIIGCLEFVQLAASVYRLSARDAKQVLDIVDTAIAAWSDERAKIDLALLLPLAVHFHRKGNVDWHAATEGIPTNFRIETPGSDHYGRKSKTANISTIVAVAREVMGSLRTAMDMSTDNMSAEREYVFHTISAEWSGAQVNDRSPSKQSQIPSLVAHAGRSLEPSGS